MQQTTDISVDTIAGVEIFFDPATKRFWARLPSGKTPRRASYATLARFIKIEMGAGKIDDRKGLHVVFWSGIKDRFVAGVLSGRVENRRRVEVQRCNGTVEMCWLNDDMYIGDQLLANELNVQYDLQEDAHQRAGKAYDNYHKYTKTLTRMLDKFSV